MRYHVVIPAAGNGFRFGASTPKQYLPLLGRPVLQHSIDRMALSFPGSTICVVLAPEDRWFEDCIETRTDMRALRCGGASREMTVRNALDALTGVEDDDWIVVHDAVRPCIDRAASLRLQSELSDDSVGGLLAIPVSDTLKIVTYDSRVGMSQPRDRMWRAQTPQMFRCGLLRKAFACPDIESWTDEAHAIEALGLQPRIVLGSGFNLKITFPEDLDLAAAIMSAQTARGGVSEV